MADPVSVEFMVKETAAAFGRIDVLVNAAGGTGHHPEADLTAPPRRGFVGLTTCGLEDWRTIVGVNLDGAVLLLPRRGPVSPGVPGRGHRQLRVGGGAQGPGAG